jgi:hypothetical protein
MGRLFGFFLIIGYSFLHKKQKYFVGSVTFNVLGTYGILSGLPAANFRQVLQISTAWRKHEKGLGLYHSHPAGTTHHESGLGTW